MAAVTGAVIGGLSAAASIYQSIDGAQKARDAQNALNDLPIPELKNPYAGMQVSKVGNELVSEQNQNRFAQNADLLRASGIRGVIGGLGQANEQAKQTDLQIKADYDKQENDIAMAQAGDEAHIRAMQEQRYMGNVSALSSQITAGNAQQMQGIHGAMQGLASGAQMYQQGKYMEKLIDGKIVPPVVNNVNKTTTTTQSQPQPYTQNPMFSSSGQGLFSTPNPYTSANLYQAPTVDIYGNIIRR
jgi:hypothetical protein